MSNIMDIIADETNGISYKSYKYFLDGSRHAYKVDDVAYKNQVYPVIAGQIGISCCARKNGEMKKFDFKRIFL